MMNKGRRLHGRTGKTARLAPPVYGANAIAPITITPPIPIKMGVRLRSNQVFGTSKRTFSGSGFSSSHFLIAVTLIEFLRDARTNSINVTVISNPDRIVRNLPGVHGSLGGKWRVFGR